MQFCINGGQGEYPLASSFAVILPAGKMVSKCGCVMTHPMLGILLANRFRFAGSDRHRAVRFEPITPYPAIAFMLLYCGESRENKKLPQDGARIAPVSLAVLVSYEPYHIRVRNDWQ